MSLIKMTFSNSEVVQRTASKGRLKVLKSDYFFGTEEICVIGKLVEGALTKEMVVTGTDKKIVSVESNYGEGHCQQKGAQVVLMIANSNKEDYSHGEEIVFERIMREQAQTKPKGRLIIA